MAAAIKKPVSQLCHEDIGRRVAVVTIDGARIEDTLMLVVAGMHDYHRNHPRRADDMLYLEFNHIGTQSEYRDGRLGVLVHHGMIAIVRDENPNK